MPDHKHTTKPAKNLRSPRNSRRKEQETAKLPQTAVATSEKLRLTAGERELDGRICDALTWRGGSNNVPRLTTARAKELTKEILKESDDDDMVRALIELVTGIAYDPESIDRDSLARAVACESFTFTPSFSSMLGSFANHAAMREFAPSVDAVRGRPMVPAPIFAEGVGQLGLEAARAAGQLCADYTVTFKKATRAFEEAMVAETLRLYPDKRREAAVHLGVTIEDLDRLLGKAQQRQTRKPKPENLKTT